jgi:putative spermidine/putrescine transport system substrate-binding protein
VKSIVTIGLVALAVALAACGGSDKPPPGALPHLAAPEGRLHLVALPGYVEDGSTDPSLDWVTPFERSTGCQVSSTVASAPDEVVRLMRTGRYDGVSALGDVSGRLVAEHLVSPVNTHLIPSYSQLFPALKGLPGNRVDGVTYGVPNGRFANLLVWRPSEVVTPRDKPISSNMLFDPSLVARYPGGVAAYGNPMFIADAALYLSHHDRDLGIDNVYELDQDQFDAAIALLREQRPNVGVDWRTSGQNVKAFASNRSVVGTAWQVTINGILAKHVKIRAGAPEEGLTGIAESWMISSRARHPNCMYMWINYITGASANAAVAENTAQAPANEHACDLTRDPSWCDTYHAADESLFNRVRLWTSPLRDCGDGRGDVCKTYDDWARAFAEVMSSR